MRALVRLITTLLALAAVGAGALLILEVAWAWPQPNAAGLVVPWPRWQTALGRLPWSAMSVEITAAVTAVVGLFLTLLAIGSGRREVRLEDPAPQVTVTTDRRSLARLVGHHVREQDGVASASVSAGRRKVHVRANSVFTDIGDLPGRLSKSAEESVGELPLSKPVSVSVYVSPAKERR